MRKSGFHVQKTSIELLGAIDLVRPSLIVSLAHDLDFWRKVREFYPETFLIGRLYENGLDWRRTTGRQWAERCAALGMPYQAFITFNEPADIYNWVTPETAAQHDDWCCDFRRRSLELGYQAVALNVPTGHLHDDSVAKLFPNICQEFDFIGLHEYSARCMWDQDPPQGRPPALVPKDEGDQEGYWYCQRYRDWYAAIIAKWPHRAGKLKMLVTECGIAMGVIPGYGDVGWKGQVTQDQYVESLCWYFGDMNEDPYCDGGAIYMVGVDDPAWSTFETLPLAPRLWAIPEIPSEPAPPPEPPNNDGGERMPIRVFNIDKLELFGDAAADLIKFHGITVHEPQNMRAGEWYWAVVLMEEREGPACFIYTTLNEAGKIVAGQECAWAWTDNMGEADDILGKNYPTDWQKQADLGLTNANGNMGPAFGQHGWSHAPYNPGPGRAWVRDPLRWSVLLTGIGWLDMTAHRTMYATWQIKQWQGDEVEPPTPPPTDGTLLQEIQGFRTDVGEKLDKIIKLMGTAPPAPPTPEKEEFTVQFFNNVNLTGAPVHTMKEAPPLLHSWELGSPVPGKVNADNISARWMGDFTFATKLYRFWIKTDDGARLFIDGEEVWGKWQDQAPTTYSVDVSLTVGKHKITLEWYEKAGGATIHFWWEPL